MGGGPHLSFAVLVGYGLNDPRAVVLNVVLNCSEASEIYPPNLLSDWGKSLYHLASHITLQTGGWREAG